MAWTYSGDPSSGVLDEVRFWCQDTDEDRPLLSDEEVQYLVDKWYAASGSAVLVAAVAAEVIAAKVTAEINISADGVSVNVGELQQRYINLAARLRDQHKSEMESGDISGMIGGVWDGSKDPVIPPLLFGVGFMDNFEIGRSDYGNYSPGDAAEVGGYDERIVSGEAEDA